MDDCSVQDALSLASTSEPVDTLVREQRSASSTGSPPVLKRRLYLRLFLIGLEPMSHALWCTLDHGIDLNTVGMTGYHPRTLA